MNAGNHPTVHSGVRNMLARLAGLRTAKAARYIHDADDLSHRFLATV
jgi:hypothetical protein